MRITIDISIHDSVALEALSQWVGADISADEIIGACIARAHDDLVKKGDVAPLHTPELKPLRSRAIRRKLVVLRGKLTPLDIFRGKPRRYRPR